MKRAAVHDPVLPEMVAARHQFAARNYPTKEGKGGGIKEEGIYKGMVKDDTLKKGGEQFAERQGGSRKKKLLPGGTGS